MITHRWLSESLLVKPFWRLALCSSEKLNQLASQSRLLSGVVSLINSRRPLQASHPACRVLLALHVLGILTTLLLCSFAETGVIGASVVATSLIVILRGLLTKQSVRWGILDVLTLLFFLTAWLSAAFSSYTHTSLIGLAKFMVFALGYFNARVLAETHPRAFKGILIALVGLGVSQALIGFYQYINHIQPLATWQDTSINPEDQLTRIFGTLKPSNPNLLAGFLIPSVALSGGFCLITLFQCRFIPAVLSMVACLITLGALVLTGSRGGFLAIGAMSLIGFVCLGHLLWHEPMLKTRHALKALWLILAGSVIALVAGGILFISPLRTRVLSIFAMREDSSNSYRLNVWASTWQMIQHNWLVGIGPGNDTFKQVYGLYMVPGYNALSAYSIFLEIWAEQGILGLMSFLLLVGVAKMRNLMTLFSTLPLTEKLWVITCYTGIAGSIVYGLFDTIWYRPSVNLLFWTLMAQLAVKSEGAPQALIPLEEGQ